MMSDHGVNPIFFNKKKKKIRRPEHSLTPIPPRPITSHFSLIPHPLKENAICVSPLTSK